tara:strand:- start:1021 stop:1200 length:180 start_codon:yes stop_codon:yes gene_type:complete
MNKFNSLNDSSFATNNTHEENKGENLIDNKTGKVLCNHCGRSASNGIRCLGICVADSDY